MWSQLSKKEHHAVARALMIRRLIELVGRRYNIQRVLGGWATMSSLNSSKKHPLVAPLMLCNMLYDDLQPCSPSMAPSNGPWPSTCWCVYGVGGVGGTSCYNTVNVKLVLHLEVASSFGQGRLHSDTEGAVIIWLPILVFWGRH